MSGDRYGQEVTVLLVADRPCDAERVELLLSEARGAMAVHTGMFTVTRVGRLAAALELLGQEQFDVVLTDLRLADSEGLPTLSNVRAAAPDVPVVVLTDVDDDGLALAAIQQGAQDYLVKDRLDGRLLRRVIRHAIHRKRAEVEILTRARQLEANRARIEQQAAELRDRADELDRINRELDDFAYIASHDLKEPLRGISGYCQILREDYQERLDDEGRRRLDALIEMCSRLGGLIESLLTYSRAGKVRPAETGIDLNRVLHRTLESLRPAIDERGASVQVVDRLPRVNGDAALVDMVLANLISNGLKFNRSERPEVEIGCLVGDPPTIYVRDNGIGIAAKHHEAIFAIFRRLHNRNEYEGSGAGLTIVRKIVESHGGRVWLESEPGRGSTFFFTLAPCGEAPAARPSAKPPHWLERSDRRAKVKGRQW